MPPKAWWVELALEPDEASAANRLKRPRALRDATLSYLDDPAVLAQLPAEAAANLRKNPFSATADLNRNGVAELYRVGFYRIPRGGGGIFIVVFEGGRQLDLEAVPTEGRSDDFSALSSANGRLNWLFCLECDHYQPVEMPKRKLHFPVEE